MKVINVSEIIGFSKAVNTKKAKKLYQLIKENLEKDIPVELDFKDIDLGITNFFNIAIGNLYKDFPSNKIDNLLKVKNANELIEKTINIVKERAKLYYTNKELRKYWNEKKKEILKEAKICI